MGVAVIWNTARMHLTEQELTIEDRALVIRALNSPRGRYGVERAHQLSGIPARTLQDWAKSGVLRPDWFNATPRGWSYRDIVYARLLAWLRSKHMDRSTAATRVQHLRELVTTSQIDPAAHSDGSIFLIGDERTDRFTGQQVFDELASVLDVFELTKPVEGVSSREIWGPSLVRPSEHTYISPWVLAGEPCIAHSRVPSATIHALSVERGLDTIAIQRLYPELPIVAIDDAFQFEQRLRAA